MGKPGSTATGLTRWLMMIGLIGLIAGLAPFAATAGNLSPRDLDLYRAAFRHAAEEHWSDAVALAAEPQERLPAKVIQWLDLARPMSGNSFAAISAFIRANPGWPNQQGLLRQAEATMPENLPAAEELAWFAHHPPISALGFSRYAGALVMHGDLAKATGLVRKFWTDSNFANADDEMAFRRQFAGMLRPEDHWARLDRVLWEHQALAAQRMLSQVDDAHKALALARLALADDEPGLEAATARVPESLSRDPGLLYERLRWRRRKDNDAGALEILRAPPAELGRPALWWTERQIEARRLIERHDLSGAYQLVSNHGQTTGQPLAEAEFLAGWLALRFLKQPAAAFQHFQRMYSAVNAPMSRARGAYWSGRAAEATGDQTEARLWYDRAAATPTMFYGQLAAEAEGGAHPLKLAGEPAVSQADAARFNRNEMVRLVRLLHEIDPNDSADRAGLFLRRMIRDAEAGTDYVLLGRLALEVRRPDLAIFASKQAFQAGITLPAIGYPTLSPRETAGLEPGLVFAIIRQESTFNSNTISTAGARGLMQLMPATARLVADKLKLRYAEPRLISDPEFNILLGSSYLSELIDNYRGSYVLAIAAYNAGSGRVQSWLAKYGDPRDGGVDPLDWVESIPIAETRNYVQRVLEALQVYRARLGRGADRTLGQDLKR